MEYVVSTTNLTKQFSKHLAVDHVSLHIKRGEIYGFIGKNGAGKTTFMKMISGLSSPTEGEIALFGDTGNERKKHYHRIGNLIEAPGLYPNMSAYHNLKCKALALGIYKDGYIEELLAMVGLADAGKKLVQKFSLGMKQRLGIAMSLIGGPDLLILDEPINGLDPQGIAEIREILLKLKDEQNMTIMISSHILEELYKIADTFGIIHQGKLIQELTRDKLEEKCSNYIELHVNDTSLACTILERIDIHNYKVVSSDAIMIYEQLSRSGEINTELIKGGCIVNSMQIKQENLENYFLSLTDTESPAARKGVK